MSIFIVGPTGIGKTTLSDAVAARFGLQRVSGSEWVKRRFGEFTGTGASGDKAAYTAAITAYSRQALRADPRACVSYLRHRYDLDGAALVVEGLRNPHDFHQLFRPERDVAIVLQFRDSAGSSSFEIGGVRLIRDGLQWLVEQQVLESDRFLSFSVGTVADMRGVTEQVLAHPAVAAAARAPDPASTPSGRVHHEIPPLRAWLRAEFLHDLDPRHAGSYVPCHIFSVSSYAGHLPTLQALLDDGSVFSYLPPQAFRLLPPEDAAAPAAEPADLVYHACPLHEFSLHRHAALSGPVQAYLRRTARWLRGRYLFTIEWHLGNDLLHAIALESAQLAFLPQHKLRFGVSDTQPLPAYRKLHAEWRSTAPEDPVAAACVVVRNEDGRMLVLHRQGGGVGLPGGTVEPGEAPRAAAARELLEECGVQVAEADLTLIYDGTTDSGRRVQTFLARSFSGAVRASQEGEAAWEDPALLVGAAGAYASYNTQVLQRLAGAGTVP